jgi:hypothetical protein
MLLNVLCQWLENNQANIQEWHGPYEACVSETRAATHTLAACGWMLMYSLLLLTRRAASAAALNRATEFLLFAAASFSQVHDWKSNVHECRFVMRDCCSDQELGMTPQNSLFPFSLSPQTRRS